MTSSIESVTRAGTTDAAQGSESTHTLIVLVEDRIGAIDRVVGVLRRRRARTQALTLSPSGTPDLVRITTQVQDAEVAVDQLVEQLRKLVDVRNVINLSAQQAVVRELALISVNTQSADVRTLLEIAQRFGASIADITPETVVLEVSGSAEKVAAVLDALQPFAIRDIARSGSIAVTHTVSA